jgi:hypothetical protein
VVERIEFRLHEGEGDRVTGGVCLGVALLEIAGDVLECAADQDLVEHSERIAEMEPAEEERLAGPQADPDQQCEQGAPRLPLDRELAGDPEPCQFELPGARDLAGRNRHLLDCVRLAG